LMERNDRIPRSRALHDLAFNVLFERAKLDVSQGELALRSGVSRPTISRIEREAGDVGVESVQRLANVFGVTVAKLFDPGFQGDFVDDDEILRRASDPPSEFVDAAAADRAFEEAKRAVPRYRKGARPRVAR